MTPRNKNPMAIAEEPSPPISKLVGKDSKYEGKMIIVKEC